LKGQGPTEYPRWRCKVNIKTDLTGFELCSWQIHGADSEKSLGIKGLQYFYSAASIVSLMRQFSTFHRLSESSRVYNSQGTQEESMQGCLWSEFPSSKNQEQNIINFISKGVPVMSKYESITKEIVSNALQTLLHDPR
jgi:hypothetical protein